MLKVSQFSFNAKDGIHNYIYNPNSKISTFQLIRNNKIIYRHDSFCMTEDNHIKRIQNDFNDHCKDLPNMFLFDFKYYWKHERVVFYLWLSLMIWYIPIRLSFNFIELLEKINVSKNKHSKSEYFTFRD